MKKLDLQKLIREELHKILETTVKKDDLDKIGDFVMSSPAFEHMNPAKLKSAIKDMYSEWKAVASNYKNIEAYFEEMEEMGGEEAFMEVKKPSKSKKSLKEGYAWERSERKFGEPLPTLASVQKAYQAKQSVLKEAIAPSFKAKHKDNNLVAAIYFSWNKAESNNASLWAKVIAIIEKQNCVLVNYVVTDSVCEFEFKPDTAAISQDLLDDIKYGVYDALKPMSSQWTGYDVYIVGN